MNKHSFEDLERTIEKERKEMHSLFMVNGNFQTEEILKKSFEIDHLINQYILQWTANKKSQVVFKIHNSRR